MPLYGDMDKLGQLIRNLERLSEVPSQVSKEVVGKITQELQNEYKAGQDSYGKAWAPLKPSTLKRGRTPPPLTSTGKMSGGTKAFPLPNAGVGINLPFPGFFHQKGTKNMAARKVLPEKTLPKNWYAAIKDAATKTIRKTLTK